MKNKNREFGFTFAAVSLALAFFSRAHSEVRTYFIILSILLLTITLGRPNLFAQPMKYWSRFGLILNKVTSPIFLFLFFYFFFTPLSLILRLFKKNEFAFRIDEHKSFWSKPSLTQSTMKDQF